MMKQIAVATVCGGLALSGCARSPDSISGSYVSPLQYRSHSCEQLSQESARINARAAELAEAQSSEATKDAVAVGTSLFLFWPAIFFIGGGDRADELARLRGELEAVEQSAIQKNCVSVATLIAEQRQAAEELQPSQEAVRN